MEFQLGDKVLFKKEDLKGEVVKVNSAYKLTILTSDGFEVNVSAKDIVKIEKGTDKATSYGDVFHQKDSDKSTPKPIKQQRSQTVLKIDLHIELLTSNYHYMDNFEIVQLQLNVCYEQLQYAMNSKITKVEIVHGIGEGVLRNEVHQILKNYKLRYYLSKNGGSTEVML